MADQFGRQNSTRWVKATVPSYGDEWGDDEYDYEENDSQVNDVVDNTQAHSVLNSGNKMMDSIEEGEDQHSYLQEHSSSQTNPHVSDTNSPSHVRSSFADHVVKAPISSEPESPNAPQDNLVLSIDNFRSRIDSDSSDDDFGIEDPLDRVDEANTAEREEDEKEEAVLGNNMGDDEIEKKTIGKKQMSITTDRTFEGPIMPPTPTFNNHPSYVPETPQSDRSFVSDADSIQKETDLFVKGDILPRAGGKQIGGDIHKEDTIRKTSNYQEYESTSDPTQHVSPQGSYSHMGEVHQPIQETISEESPSVHPINEKIKEEPSSAPAPLVLSIDNKDFDSDDDDDDWGYNGKNSDSDSERQEDERVVDIPPTAHTTSHNTAPNSSHKTDLDDLITDLQNNSLNHDISLPDYHDYVEDSDDEKINLETREFEPSPIPTPTEPLALGGHKRSIRKPPPISSDDFFVPPPPKKESKELPPVVEDINTIGGFSLQHENESTGSLSTGRFSFAPSHLSNQMIDIKSMVSPLPPVPHNPSTVASSPLEFQPPKFEPEVLSRRDSTMTTNTFNMGNWQPNTNNFRDQFINDNDNESRMSYLPSNNEEDDNDDTANYKKFTNLGQLNEDEEERRYNHDDMESANLGLSIPDTIDATIPRNVDDEDEEEEEEVESLQPMSTGADSVLKDHPHVNPLFKEEKMTPMSSMLDVVKEEDSKKAEIPRAVSKDSSTSASTTTPAPVVSETNASVVSSATTAIGGVYPPYDWKNIVSKSQSIDRIKLLKEASALEVEYDSGLNYWLSETLRASQQSPTIHIGKIATAVYQNAPHSDIRRHNSIRSKVKIVTGAVETSGFQASSLGKRFLSKGKKLIKSSD